MSIKNIDKKIKKFLTKVDLKTQNLIINNSNINLIDNSIKNITFKNNKIKINKISLNQVVKSKTSKLMNSYEILNLLNIKKKTNKFPNINTIKINDLKDFLNFNIQSPKSTEKLYNIKNYKIKFKEKSYNNSRLTGKIWMNNKSSLIKKKVRNISDRLKNNISSNYYNFNENLYNFKQDKKKNKVKCNRIKNQIKIKLNNFFPLRLNK